MEDNSRAAGGWAGRSKGGKLLAGVMSESFTSTSGEVAREEEGGRPVTWWEEEEISKEFSSSSLWKTFSCPSEKFPIILFFAEEFSTEFSSHTRASSVFPTSSEPLLTHPLTSKKSNMRPVLFTSIFSSCRASPFFSCPPRRTFSRNKTFFMLRNCCGKILNCEHNSRSFSDKRSTPGLRARSRGSAGRRAAPRRRSRSREDDDREAKGVLGAGVLLISRFPGVAGPGVPGGLRWTPRLLNELVRDACKLTLLRVELKCVPSRCMVWKRRRWIRMKIWDSVPFEWLRV